MNCKLGTKAETLEILRENGFNVPELFYFNTEEWVKNKNAIIDCIQHSFKGYKTVIIRSSSGAEDGNESSNAGAFESVLNIKLTDIDQLQQAIERVINSYQNNCNEQVLVQHMVENIALSGVIMTRCLEDGSPYYVINYDDESGKTDSITGGTGVSKTVYIYKGVSNDDFDSERVQSMVTLIRNLEAFFANIPLDIEFSIDHDKKIHLFQVRRICTCKNWNHNVEAIVSDKISFVERFVSHFMLRRTNLYGTKSILGVMPDWNPAEIIGITPRPLAASLYRELITRKNWSKSRELMGYRKMPPEELMVLVAGRPYIDVRNSFNSFLPEGLSPIIAEKIINAWINRLSDNPQYHDKVEFEVATTICDPCFAETFLKRYRGILSENEFDEYQKALLNLTNSNLLEKGSLSIACRQIDDLAIKQKNYPEFSINMDILDILSLVKKLLADCSEYGTLPFAIIARHGFIVESFLQAMVHKGAITAERIDIFKKSVQTVSGKMSYHFIQVCQKEMSSECFFKLYGHLRPGTYDILSPKYSDRKEIFINQTEIHNKQQPCHTFSLSPDEENNLNRVLKQSGITAVNAKGLMNYAAKSISGREYAKFVFTKNLSKALEGLKCWGEKIGITNEDISLLNITDILDSLYSQLDDKVKEHFLDLTKQGAKQYELANSFKLSYLIRSPKDIYIVPQHRSTPNFITTQSVEAPVVVIAAESIETQHLDGCIICIESADPGYDWIFTRSIAGLVTKFGGTNSHMAIRCAEFSLPAAIGCGEMLYEKISSSPRCNLNAGQKSLSPSYHSNGGL